MKQLFEPDNFYTVFVVFFNLGEKCRLFHVHCNTCCSAHFRNSVAMDIMAKNQFVSHINYMARAETIWVGYLVKHFDGMPLFQQRVKPIKCGTTRIKLLEFVKNVYSWLRYYFSYYTFIYSIWINTFIRKVL